jgi:hypothetical protein
MEEYLKIDRNYRSDDPKALDALQELLEISLNTWINFHPEYSIKINKEQNTLNIEVWKKE